MAMLQTPEKLIIADDNFSHVSAEAHFLTINEHSVNISASLLIKIALLGLFTTNHESS